MQTAELADRFLRYFEKRDHTIVPSASLVTDDPALLFTVAGMVPFIPYLSGDVPAPYLRAADVQKCIRTNDIEEVGKTPRHGTFFQMLGNWSFGDYFKEGAITYAWELLTTSEADGGLGFDPKDLWVTVYKDDDEAAGLWRTIAGLPEERIQRLDKDTNYWSTGLPGPAGPCSEIFFDQGPAYGVDGGPATDDDRYVEIWNLVFMQYAIDDVTSKYDFRIVGELPQKNIDTGMGLERIAFIKQGVQNMYETDQVRPVLDLASELSGRRYGADHGDDVRMRIIADHVRSSLMLLSDGVTPSNEGRGYILRRLMRRGIRSMRLLGVDGPTFPELFAASRDAMKAVVPRAGDGVPAAVGVRRRRGGDVPAHARGGHDDPRPLGRPDEGGRRHDDRRIRGVPAARHLRLPDRSHARDRRGGRAERRPRPRSTRSCSSSARARRPTPARASARSPTTASTASSARKGETVFTGYTDLETESTVLGVLVDGVSVDRATTGQIAEVILADTALYAESGGQVADKGIIVGPGYELDVLDVQKPVAGLISHTVEVTSGEVGVGQPATSVVDAVNRRAARQAHSATHLVHAALRDTLGKSATQAGSLNRAGYMRLDFTWGQALSPETRTEIEEIANNAVRDNLEVTTRVLSLDEAKSLGAMALFGEKYGDTVRMVDIGGPWSRELCAGTHVSSSAEIGLVNLVGESSVGASNRRVEALVGQDAFRELAAERAIVSQLTSTLKTPRDQLPARIAELAASLKAAEKKIAAFEARALTDRIPALAANAVTVGPHRVVAESIGSAASADDVRSLALGVRDRLGSDAGVVAIGAEIGGRPVVIVATNDAARTAGARAGALAKVAATTLGGGGGGRDDVAQGGGADAAALPAALSAVKDALGAR